jgi:hypothetical protein
MNITQIPDSVNITVLAYTGNDGSIIIKVPPIMGAIMPPLSVDEVKKPAHNIKIVGTYMRESAVAAPQAVPRTDGSTYEHGVLWPTEL